MLKKTLIAAAVAAMAVSGAANAAISSGEMFVMAYDSTTKNTFIATLDSVIPSAASFTGTSNVSVNFTTDANWTAFTSAAGFSAATTTYQVLSADLTAGNVYSTSNNLVAGTQAASGVTTTQVSNTTAPGGSISTWLGYYTGTGASSALVASGVNGNETQLGSNWSNYMSFKTDAALGSNDSFFKIVTTPAVTSGRTIITPAGTLTTQYAGVWNLSSAGALTYTVAAVPEADTWAMLVAGLGLMGFMARRRLGA